MSLGTDQTATENLKTLLSAERAGEINGGGKKRGEGRGNEKPAVGVGGGVVVGGAR